MMRPAPPSGGVSSRDGACELDVLDVVGGRRARVSAGPAVTGGRRPVPCCVSICVPQCRLWVLAAACWALCSRVSVLWGRGNCRACA
eukprot:1497316-Prymnesium_polylepis.3